MVTRIHEAINWNEQIDNFTQAFWDQNWLQMWKDTEFSPGKDSKVWRSMSPEERDVYKKVLGGLTLLDTEQSIIGMPSIAYAVPELQRKAVLSFMGMMESMHAKSYSTIFTTLLVKEEIDEVFEWVKENKYLQYKAEVVTRYYKKTDTPKDLYMAMVASVLLESFLFYSGFFFPLYLAGQAPGRMVHSGEIINLILRDEAIHGLYVGMIAQEIYITLSEADKKEVTDETYRLLFDLMDNEYLYTEEIYAQISLDTEVKRFLRYNANKALMNLGMEPHYDNEEINPIVENGLNTLSTHDFFSTKGFYVSGIVEPLRDEDFNMNYEDEFIVN
ncbi:class 1b ribonucleoside-diphosphate reductase subunit beta [Paenibacillus illinoisensis]|uniref:class 1b ribonucleoside-diphosphate reductase subunit beta n=1 Tax=Paenibacillus illinoisensis TaxID=59845 RepID=UPI00301A7572